MKTNKRTARSKPAAPRVIVGGATLTSAQEGIWRAVNEDLTAPEFGRRKRGYAGLRRLEDQLAQARTLQAVRRGIEESTALARSRGEDVEVSPTAEARGRVRIRSRDGLETLARTGAITNAQYRAGMVYRDLYEATDPERDLRSQMASPALAGAGAKGGPGGAEAWAERRLRLSRSIAAIDDKVRSADRNGRAVRALREVAGHARCLSHFVAGGGSQAVYRRALVLALEVCATHFRLQ